MAKYSVPLTTWANTAVTVETDETDPEIIAEIAESEVYTGLCHQCASKVDLGDDWSSVTHDGKPEVYKEDE
jgi:hypothetical protein